MRALQLVCLRWSGPWEAMRLARLVRICHQGPTTHPTLCARSLDHHSTSGVVPRQTCPTRRLRLSVPLHDQCMLQVANLSRRGTDLFPLQSATLCGQIWPAHEDSWLLGHCAHGQGVLAVLLGARVRACMVLSLTNVINSGRRLDGAQLAAPTLKCGLPERSGGTKCLGEAAPFQESSLIAPTNGNDARCGVHEPWPSFCACGSGQVATVFLPRFRCVHL